MQRGLQKIKRVSWAEDGNLCQVKLFSSNDCPSKVGIGTKINYTKVSMRVSDNCLPLRVEAQTQWKNKLGRIPLVKWTCPPTFGLSPLLRVAAGEESEELQTENQRELRVLEAVYPRPSVTPPNAIVSSVVGNASFDDSITPLVPLTPIEEEEAGGDDPLNKAVQPSSMAQTPLKNGTLADCNQPQLPTITSAALPTLLSTTKEHENLIDRELLMKILSNPTILEQFLNGKGNPIVAPVQSAAINPFSNPHTTSSTVQPSLVAPVQSGTTSQAVINPISNPHTTSSIVPSKGVFYPSPPITALASLAQPTVPTNVAVAAPPAKDMHYYKNLIQQHGSGTQQGAIHPQSVNPHVGFNPKLASVGNKQTRVSKPKLTKFCFYFNSLKGCKNGANCTFQHDPSRQKRTSNIIEMQSAKRMKVDTVMRGSQIYS